MILDNVIVSRIRHSHLEVQEQPAKRGGQRNYPRSATGIGRDAMTPQCEVSTSSPQQLALLRALPHSRPHCTCCRCRRACQHHGAPVALDLDPEENDRRRRLVESHPDGYRAVVRRRPQHLRGGMFRLAEMSARCRSRRWKRPDR